jgi:hypothetical protein
MNFRSTFGLVFCCVLASVLTARAQDSGVPSNEQIQKVVDSLVTNWKQQQAETQFPRTKYNDAQRQIWAALDQAQAQGTALKMIMNPKSADEVNVSIDWLYDEILNHNANAAYEYAYAGILYQAGNQYPQAVIQAQSIFMAANLAMRVDAARCADPTAAQAVIQHEWSAPIVIPVMKSIDGVDENKRFKLRLNAAALEKLRGPREPQPWICRYGTQAVMGAVAQGALPNASVQKQADGSTQVGVDTSAVQANLVDDAAWLARRDQILAASQTPRAKSP